MAMPKTIRLFEEISVFNEIINDNSKIHKLHECIDPYGVSIKRHRALRRAISELNSRQHPIDLVNLSLYLADHALLDEVGGFKYLRYIAVFHNSTVSKPIQDLHPSDKPDNRMVLGANPID